MNIHRSQRFWYEQQGSIWFQISAKAAAMAGGELWKEMVRLTGVQGTPADDLFGNRVSCGWSSGAISSDVFLVICLWFWFGWSQFFTGSGCEPQNFSTILSSKNRFSLVTLPPLEVWWTDSGDELQRIGRFRQEGEWWAVRSKWLTFLGWNPWQTRIAERVSQLVCNVIGWLFVNVG